MSSKNLRFQKGAYFKVLSKVGFTPTYWFNSKYLLNRYYNYLDSIYYTIAFVNLVVVQVKPCVCCFCVTLTRHVTTSVEFITYTMQYVQINNIPIDLIMFEHSQEILNSIH